MMAKAVDDHDPIAPVQVPRGYGGTAILYRNGWNIRAIKHPDGQERINVLELETNPRICVINAYMPSRGNSKMTDFVSTLDEIAEIIAKFNLTHAILLCGDLNSSLSRNPPNDRDLILREFVKVNSLHTFQNGTATYFLPGGQACAEIDYILTNDLGKNVVSDVWVESEDHQNTSDHQCVRCTIELSYSETKNRLPPLSSKPQWHKCNKSSYRLSVETQLKTNPIQEDQTTEQAIEHLTTILTDAARSNIPGSRKQQKNRNRKKLMSREIKHASIHSKQAWWKWKTAGAPSDRDNPHFQQMTKAKKLLRKHQRHKASEIHRYNMEKIADSVGDDRLFYQLIRRQRATNSAPTEILRVDGEIIDNPEMILDAWATYFQDLATPKSDPNFDTKFLERIEKDVTTISSLCTASNHQHMQITTQETMRALKSLKNNKAPDITGLMAEHIKYAGSGTAEALCKIINKIYRESEIPASLKRGVLTPVFKKGSPEDPGNYRGISVTPIILKVLEHIFRTRHDKILQASQSSLQTGFTKGTSSATAAILLTECQMEAKSKREALYLTTLDTQKAFDVVNHNILLHRLYNDGIQGKDWLLLKDLYDNMTTTVKWNGDISRSVGIKQGVRQGGVLSTDHYKRYNNPLLLQLEEYFTGATIGTTKIQHITCADDIALISSTPREMQEMLLTVETYSKESRYKINPTKSALISYNATETPYLTLHGDKIPPEEETVHLGIHRRSTGKCNVPHRINTGRRTVYSLMGAGCHGKSGTGQGIRAKMWSTYVVPRFIYGLETQALTMKDEALLDGFQVRMLKQIQHLPDRTSNTAALSLLGIPPVSAIIHKNLLNLVFKITTRASTLEHEVAVRQLAVKDFESDSLFSKARRLLQYYNLPTMYTLMEQPPTIGEWKRMLKSAVEKEVLRMWRDDISSKSSLKYLDPDLIKIGEPHHVYATVRPNTHDIQRAEIKARLLTGTYTLQANRARFNQNEVDGTCRLCSKDIETREHFIATCEALEHLRKDYNIKVAMLLKIQPQLITQLDRDHYTQMTLDPLHPSLPLELRPTDEALPQMELRSRELIFSLHKTRTHILANFSNTNSK